MRYPDWHMNSGELNLIESKYVPAGDVRAPVTPVMAGDDLISLDRVAVADQWRGHSHSLAVADSVQESGETAAEILRGVSYFKLGLGGHVGLSITGQHVWDGATAAFHLWPLLISPSIPWLVANPCGYSESDGIIITVGGSMGHYKVGVSLP